MNEKEFELEIVKLKSLNKLNLEIFERIKKYKKENSCIVFKLKKLEMKENCISFYFEENYLQMEDLGKICCKFNNLFNDQLLTAFEYRDLEPIIEKYSLLNPSKSVKII